MNRISKFCVARSVLRRNPFTRWSSKPIPSSLISNNPTSSLISKFHHTFNYPPQIPLNHFRKFSGEAATEECNFDGDDLQNEIYEIHGALINARRGIDSGSLSPHHAVIIPAEKFIALMKKLGLANEKAGDYPHHLQRFGKKIQHLKEEVDETVAFGECVAAGENYGSPCWDLFKSSGEAAAAYNFDYDYLKKEISEVYFAIGDTRFNIESGTVPPLDAVKIPVEKFKAFMEKFGLDNEKAWDYPLHLQRFRGRIRNLEQSVDEIVAFGEYVANAEKGGVGPCWLEFRDWYHDAGVMLFKPVSFESKNQSDALPTAQDQIAMPVNDVSAVVTENLADNTNQGLPVESSPKRRRSGKSKVDASTFIAAPRTKTRRAAASKVTSGVYAVSAAARDTPEVSQEVLAQAAGFLLAATGQPRRSRSVAAVPSMDGRVADLEAQLASAHAVIKGFDAVQQEFVSRGARWYKEYVLPPALVEELRVLGFLPAEE